MTTFRFLHAADLHVDSPLLGLGRYEGAPVDELRIATRVAVENMVRLAIDRSVDLVVLAGDLYDGDWKDYNTGLYFHRQLARMTAAGIRVALLHGNHDAANRMTRSLTPPDGVTVFDTASPSTVRFAELGVALHGQGFATAAVEDDLAAGYPDPVPGLVNIGVLHTALEGDANHARYAPCSLRTLQQRGYDYWALGHVHEHRIVAEDPFVVFPGNTQGRHARETGPKGCVVVDVVDGAVRRPVFHALDDVRWAAPEIDATGVADLPALLARVRAAVADAVARAGDRRLACRVGIVGTTPLHDALAADPERLRNDVRGVALEAGGTVWIEKVRLRTRPPAASAGGGLDDLAPGLAADAAVDAEVRAAVEAAVKAPVDALPVEVRAELADEDLDAVLGEARDLLRGRLRDDRGDAP